MVIGKFCEARDPYLAYIAYAKGLCDDELITITNDNSMFKQQAPYLIKRRQPDLWAQVLVGDNMHRRSLIDQIVATALPECTDPDDVSVTVKAFLQADLPLELIELLEKIIIEPSPFSDNKNLQNLLLLTAIRADKGKVVGYINKLQNYDAADIARIATEHGLYEEALTIYKKHEQHAMAINVLVEHIVSIDRGLDYANKVNQPEVWSRLAKAQLDGLRIKDSVGMYQFLFNFTSFSFYFQSPTSRHRIPRTSQRSSRLPTMLASTTSLFVTSRWLASISANPRSTQSLRTPTPRLTASTIWKTSLE